MIGVVAHALFVAVGLAGASAPGLPAALAAESNAWCGDDGSDWLCRQEGAVHVVREQGRIVVGAAPQRLEDGSRVRVEATGLARITFKREAFCEVGGVATRTKLITRAGRSLFQQNAGKTSCISRGKRKIHFGFHCGVDEPCPARLWSTGKVMTEWRSRAISQGLVTSPPDELSLAAGERRELRAIVCDGKYRAILSQGASVAEAEVGVVSGLSWALIRIVEEEHLFELHVTVRTGGCPSDLS
ncbi:MAG TPA: hypothetical protein VFT79_09085 [Solirubrobacterales bacterium]|nr:hypothetical protein [Solirubrobacterales bacterium]